LRYLIGLGNYTAHDDAIGVCVIEHIVAGDLEHGFRAIDLGANAMNLVAYLDAATEAIVIVDAAQMGQEPGTFRVFSPVEVETQKQLPGISTHEGDVLAVLNLARTAGSPIPPVMMMGVEPQDMTSGIGLSACLAGQIDFYARAAIDCLRGIRLPG